MFKKNVSLSNKFTIYHLDKKSKKDFFNAVEVDNGNLNYVDFKPISNPKALVKLFKKFLKQKSLFKVIQDESTELYILSENKEDVDGTYHIQYWLNNDSKEYNNLILKFLSYYMQEYGKTNIVLNINENDHQIIEKFLNNKKIMFFDDQVFYISGTSEESGDEWSQLENFNKDELFGGNDYANVEQTVDLEQENIQEESNFENDDFEQELEDSQEEPEQSQEEMQEEQKEFAEKHTFEEREAVNEETIEEPINNEEEAQQSEEELEEPFIEQTEPKRESDYWAKQFYSLKGDSNNGILSTMERFKDGKIQGTYAKLNVETNSYDTGSLKDLKNKSDFFDSIKRKPSSYEESRRRVLENLSKLKSVNYNNKSSINNLRSSFGNESIFKSNKVSDAELIEKINSLKRKINTK